MLFRAVYKLSTAHRSHKRQRETEKGGGEKDRGRKQRREAGKWEMDS
jgi:hypothetical protein